MEVSEQIIQVLDALGKKFGIAVDWSQQNVLPWLEKLAEKLVAYELYSSVAWIGIAVVAIAAGFVLAWILVRNSNTWDADYRFFIWGCYTAFCVVFIAVIGRQVFDIVACKIFPEKVLLDYITKTASTR